MKGGFFVARKGGSFAEAEEVRADAVHGEDLALR
nr:MAG TPA: hypothetical protein [Caudoviricetes sp.]